MIYVESRSANPYFNLAMEQYLFETIGQNNEIFFLWQNDKAVIIGKNQNTEAEINKEFIAKNGIKVVRRLSGGGAVYHDLGNLNFTFITSDDGSECLDMRKFCRPIINALRSIGANAEFDGRNDITLNGMKISGSAQYRKNGFCLHHGTIIFDSDLSFLEQALNPSFDKMESKGVSSVRRRVTTVREHISGEYDLERFKNVLKQTIIGDGFAEYRLTASDINSIKQLSGHYKTWEWTFGASPRFNMHKERRVEGCGKIEVYMEVNAGVIEHIKFFGDFFGSGDCAVIERRLTGCRLNEDAVRDAIVTSEIWLYFYNLTIDGMVDILCK